MEGKMNSHKYSDNHVYSFVNNMGRTLTVITPLFGRMVLFIFIFRLIHINAQEYLNSQGKPSFTTPQSVDNGFINLATGTLHIEIPMYSLPQRGKIPLNARMVYDSRIWSVFFGQAWSPDSYAGWRFVTDVVGLDGAASYSCSRHPCGPPIQGHYTDYYNFTWTAPD